MIKQLNCNGTANDKFCFPCKAYKQTIMKEARYDKTKKSKGHD
jgi:hypothetical protein